MWKALAKPRLSATAALLALALTALLPSASETYAQSTPAAAPSAAVLSQPTIKALQEALNKQGVATKTDGVLTDDTRAAIRKYQSQHHLPVTGEPDKATLDKLGVASKSSSAGDAPTTSAATTGQAAQPSTGATASPQMPSGEAPAGMMSGPMMQGMMQGMMKTMQGMMGMMQSQPEQAQPGQMQQGRMRQGQAQGAMAMNCPMMSGQSGPAMMQMMQGMMQMMQMMQSQMQPGQKS